MTGYDDDTDVWEYEPAPPSPEDVAAAREQALAAAEEAERAVAVAGSRPRKAVRDVATEAGRQAGAKVARRFGVLALIAALVVPWLVSGLAYSQSVQTDQMVQAMAQRLDNLNVVLESRGQEPVSPTETGDPTAVAAAAVLAEVLTRLPEAPSAEQVARELQPAVTANVLGPTLDQLTVMVADYFQRNPPRPGPPPSQADIDAAVARNLADNPPPAGEDGEDGEKGDPGDPGPAGPAGADGRSILTGPEPVRLDDGSCVWRSTYDRAPEVVEYPAGDDACPGGDNGGGGGLIAPGTSVMAPFLSLIGWSSR